MFRSLVMAFICASTTHVWAETPVNCREQQMLFSRAEVHEVAAQAYQIKLTQLAALGELDTNRNVLERIRRVSARLITQAIKLKPDSANWPWEIHATTNDQVSAFSMAGGKLLIGNELISQLSLNDDELAVALAHEMGHVIAEHVREQISMAAILDPPPPNRHQDIDEVVAAMESDISLFLRLQPLSRLQELEADDIGIELAARAGVPAKSIRSFYDKLTAEESGQSLFDTHGSLLQRSRFVRSMLPYASIMYEAGLNTSTPTVPK